MAASYRDVYLVDVPRFTNTMIFATTEPTAPDDVRHNLSEGSGLYSAVARSALTEGGLRRSTYRGQVFTDDLAPVERLIDEIIFSYVSGR